jgi:hypothetical protein
VTTRPRGRLVALAIAAALTCAVALYNGFPLTYWDSASYLKKAYAFTHPHRPLSLDVGDYQQAQLPPSSPFRNPFFYRPGTYTVFLVPFANPRLLAAVPLLKGLIIVFVVALALRAAGAAPAPLEFVLLFGALCACTSLPWFTGQLMPDFFTGAVVLLFFVMLAGGERLALWERLTAGLLLTGAIATHLSHLPLYAGLAALGLGYRQLSDRSLITGRAFAVSILGPLALAVTALVGSNYVFSRKPVLSESSGLFYLARLVGDGTAQRYLADVCPGKRYLLCDERGNLPRDADYFLWEPAGPWARYQNDPRFLTEAGDIVRGTLRGYWREQAAASIGNTFAQLGSFGVDGDLARPHPQVMQLLTTFGNATLARYEDSRQIRRILPLDAASAVQQGCVYLSLLVLLACGPMLRATRQRGPLLLAGVVLAGVGLNAAVVGALSAVHDRYQSRVMWLLPLAAFVAVRPLLARVSSPQMAGSAPSRQFAGGSR